jgi:hypothetical protein
MTEAKFGIPPQPIPQTPVPQSTPLTPQLEARIAAIESAAPTSAFDHAGWFWMIVLGGVIPLALLVLGWWV